MNSDYMTVCAHFRESSENLLIWSHRRKSATPKIHTHTQTYTQNRKNDVLNEKCCSCANGRFDDFGESCWLWIVSRINVVLQWSRFIVCRTKGTHQFNYRRSEWQTMLLWSCLLKTRRLLLRFQTVLWR